MTAATTAPPLGVGSDRSDPPATPAAPRPRRFGLILGLVVAASAAVRLASIDHGLPFSYNPDEELHFVPHAAAAADGDWNPRYFDNPSALTYLLGLVFKAAFGGEDVTRLLAHDPTAVYAVARVVVALLGVALVLAVCWTGCRYFDHRVGLIAAALAGLGFLPVYYGHQALNDAPTMLPATLALLGCLWIRERGTLGAHLLTGAMVGLAAGTKYLAAPLALVVVLAVVLRLASRRERPTRAGVLLVAAGAAALVALVATNPYLVVEFELARDQLTGQSTHAATAKLGQEGAAWSYYPRTLLWGFGVVPTLFAVIGAAAALRSNRGRALLLLAFPVLLYAYLSTQERFFGRWLLSAYPALAILAGYGVTRAAAWWRDRAPRPAAGAAAAWTLPALLALVLAQPVFDSVRSDVVLGRTDTRTLALGWIHANMEDRRIVVEPSVPSDYLEDEGFVTYPVDRPYQAYETRLEPALLDDYRRRGYCWVLVSSHQRDRGLAAGLEASRAYYDRLTRESDRVVVFSPYRSGARSPDFSYDLSFNWYPLAHRRPGPYLELRHLSACSPGAGSER